MGVEFCDEKKKVHKIYLQKSFCLNYFNGSPVFCRNVLGQRIRCLSFFKNVFYVLM